jgi:hypothetical protein
MGYRFVTPVSRYPDSSKVGSLATLAVILRPLRNWELTGQIW